MIIENNSPSYKVASLAIEMFPCQEKVFPRETWPPPIRPSTTVVFSVSRTHWCGRVIFKTWITCWWTLPPASIVCWCRPWGVWQTHTKKEIKSGTNSPRWPLLPPVEPLEGWPLGQDNDWLVNKSLHTPEIQWRAMRAWSQSSQGQTWGQSQGLQKLASRCRSRPRPLSATEG